jgi:hypothetical protein
MDGGAGGGGERDPGRDWYVFYTTESSKVEPFDAAPGVNPEFRFLADLEACPDTRDWRWGAFAIIEADDASSARQIGDRIAQPPDPVDEIAKPDRVGTRAMRRTKHFPHFGIARLRVAQGKVREVLDRLDTADEPQGGGTLPKGMREALSGCASIGQGGFDVVVELGHNDRDKVCGLLMKLRRIEGVTNVEAALVTGEHYYYRPPNKPGKKYRVGTSEDA